MMPPFTMFQVTIANLAGSSKSFTVWIDDGDFERMIWGSDARRFIEAAIREKVEREGKR